MDSTVKITPVPVTFLKKLVLYAQQNINNGRAFGIADFQRSYGVSNEELLPAIEKLETLVHRISDTPVISVSAD